LILLDWHKDDGITTAQWLSSLASFVGAFYRKFPNVEVHGLLSHLLRKLSEGSVVELCVLQSLLKIAGGYGFADCTSIASLSPVQLEGRCGSLHLRRETSDFGVIEKFDSISSSKLRYAFQSTNFGAIFLILLAQIRYKLLNMNMKKIKLIGNALDSCQRTSYLLLTFITDSLEEESLNEDPSLSLYAKTLPNQRNLLHLHGLESDDIWTLSRPIFKGSLLNDPTVTLASFVDFQTVQDMISSCYNDFVSPILYCLFFTLSIYDITFPEDRYRLEINRLNREIDRLTKLQKGGKEAQGTISALAQAAASAGVTGRELKDAASFTKAHERELMRMKRVVDTLTADMIRQKSHVERINLLLDRDKAILFQSSSEHTIKCGIIRAFISECVSTRCRSSPDDAMYCSRFTMLLHTLDTPNFYTLFYFDTVIESVARVLFGVTEDEASNFSIFLEETWKNINLYRFEPNLYESVIQGKVRYYLFLDFGHYYIP
jgi:THO complex subunit 2